jgi:hypothetical protein
VPVEAAKEQLIAAGFKRRADIRDEKGEWWAHPSGWPVPFLQYIGLDKGNFDSDQLAFTLAQGGPFRPGRTFGSNPRLS